jgi:hypothetical protein
LKLTHPNSIDKIIIFENSNVISVYISKIERELEGREDREEIKEVLLRSIVEKVLVAEELRRKGKSYDKRYIEMQGRK